MALITPRACEEMMAYLDQQLHLREGADGKPTWDCDHSLRYTAQWLREQHKAVADNLEMLEELGAYCDCEVLLNIEEWPDPLELARSSQRGQQQAGKEA